MNHLRAAIFAALDPNVDLASFPPPPSRLGFPIILAPLGAEIGAEGRKAFRASTDRPGVRTV